MSKGKVYIVKKIIIAKIQISNCLKMNFNLYKAYRIIYC